MTAPTIQQARRILFLRLGAIGDVLRVLPALARVRRDLPDAEIGWSVEQWVAPILRDHPDIARLHILDRRELVGGPWRAVREIRRHAADIRSVGYDVVLDFHGLLKSGAVSALSRIPARVGYAASVGKEANHLFNNIHVDLEDRWENRVQRFLHLLAPLGVSTDYDSTAHGLHLPSELRSQAMQRYVSWGGPELAVYPGTSLPRAGERWPVAKWVELIDRLGARGIRTVIFWGPAEADLSAEIAAAVTTPACSLAPPTGLLEMMALLGCFPAFLGSDTAAMHMAWLQGVSSGVFLGYKPTRTASPLPPCRWRGLRVERFIQEGRGRLRQSDQIVGAVPVDEAMDAVLYLLGDSRDVVGDSGTDTSEPAL